jgi:hypothetical protein
MPTHEGPDTSSDAASPAWRPSSVWLAVRLSIWLSTLPVRLRIYGLPALLHRLTPARRRALRRQARGFDQAVRVITWVCQRRVFCLPIFPRPCLRQALALYRTLTRLGHPATIHFGVVKRGDGLHGHSWVTVQGTPIAEDRPTEVFHVVYAYPPDAAVEIAGNGQSLPGAKLWH